MVADAETHADEDRRARALAEARNNGENAAYQAEKQLADLGDQVDADSKSRIEDAVKAVRETLESEDAEADQRQAPRSSRTPSTRSPRRCTSAPRSRRPAPAPTGPRRDGDAGGSSEDEDVVDAEVVDEPKV